MKFDPNAATARYIDSLGPAALQKAHDYTVGREWLLLWDLVVAAVVTWLIVRSGILGRLEAKIAERRRNLRAFVISLVYFVVAALLTLPWTIYEGWWREKGYGRTSQPFGDWIGQDLLSTAITSVVAALFFIGVYWLIRRSGRAWWLWAGGLTAIVLAFVMLLEPVFTLLVIPVLASWFMPLPRAVEIVEAPAPAD